MKQVYCLQADLPLMGLTPLWKCHWDEIFPKEQLKSPFRWGFALIYRNKRPSEKYFNFPS